MHRIRLREPWLAEWDVDSGAIIYTRKFHKPTGCDQQSITLKISLLPHEGSSEASIVVFVNGVEVEAHAQTPQSALYRLEELPAFNSLQCRIFGLTATNGPALDTTVVPIFGSFVIESVELQIE